MFGPTVSPQLVQSGKGRIASDPALLNLPRPLMVGAFSVPWQRRTNLWPERTNLSPRTRSVQKIIQGYSTSGAVHSSAAGRKGMNLRVGIAAERILDPPSASET